MVKKNRPQIVRPQMIDAACVIHGQGYDWHYVDRLYSMLQRYLSVPVTLHVYTEHHRPVPPPYVKHTLIDWGISGPKKSWWYKMQLFNSDTHRGPLLYFDLDTVIVRNIDWILGLGLDNLWAVRDFKYLWKPNLYNLNSSILWWDTTRFDHIWRGFVDRDLQEVMRKYHGDQDYITEQIPVGQRRCFDAAKIKSWRWQCLDGGFDFRKRRFLEPGQGTRYDGETCVLVFHGTPKPHDVDDPVIVQLWQ